MVFFFLGAVITPLLLLPAVLVLLQRMGSSTVDLFNHKLIKNEKERDHCVGRLDVHSHRIL